MITNYGESAEQIPIAPNRSSGLGIRPRKVKVLTEAGTIAPIIYNAEGRVVVGLESHPLYPKLLGYVKGNYKVSEDPVAMMKRLVAEWFNTEGLIPSNLNMEESIGGERTPIDPLWVWYLKDGPDGLISHMLMQVKK